MRKQSRIDDLNHEQAFSVREGLLLFEARNPSR